MDNSDADFYMLKINRLEADLSDLQEELMTARLRLRTAQDFQIKYQLLLKQSQQENYHLKMYESQLQQKINESLYIKLSEKQKQWKQQQEERQKAIAQEYETKILSLNREVKDLEQKWGRDKEKEEDWELLQFTNKKLKRQNEILNEQINNLKPQYQLSKEEQISSVKEELTHKYRERLESERRFYAQKIAELQNQIEDLRENQAPVIVEKKQKQTADWTEVRDSLMAKINGGTQEIQRLNQSLDAKDQQIRNLIEEKIASQRAHSDEKDELSHYISTLEEKIYQIQQKQTSELINLKERMEAIKEQECETLKQNMKKLEENFEAEKNTWSGIIKQKQKESYHGRNSFDEERSSLKQQNKRLKSKIEELKGRLDALGDNRQVGQTQNLIKSLKDIENRQSQMGNYENGVTFLDRQLKKCINKLEQKNLETTQLKKQISQMRTNTQKDIEGALEQFRNEKKTLKERAEKCEEQLNKIREKLRNRELQHKQREKNQQLELEKLKITNKSLKSALEESHKDYMRLVDAKKQLETNLRSEKEKGVTSISDLSAANKQKWIEVEKQKSQLQIMYKQKEGQLRKKIEIETQNIRHQRDRLLAENQKLKGKLESMNERNGDTDKENKKKLYEDYEKKIATLNLQIALTENLYSSFKTAKSRTYKEESESIPQDNSVSDQLSMSFHPRGE